MWILLLEAFGAMAVGVFIVWWTMFAGRTRGERRAVPSRHDRHEQGDGEDKHV